MSAQTATGGMQWQQGGVRVALDVAPADVAAGLSRVWQRISDEVDALSAEEWEHPTRCSEWAVVDIVNHLADTADWVTTCMDAAVAGRESSVFKDFDPIRIPKRLTDAADRTPATARRRLAEAFATLRSGLEGADLAGTELRVESPLGPQPPIAGLTHLFWDTWLHERDLFLPLGRQVPEVAGDLRLAALYTLRMEAYIRTLMHREVHVGLELHGGLEATVVLDVAAGEERIRVLGEGDTDVPANLLRGDAATAVDALCGRGDLAAALEGAEEVRSSISVLRTVLSGP